MCFRSIFNYKYGFEAVLDHRNVVNQITLALMHHSAKTKATVLDLLAAVAMIKGGHELVLKGFDNFKQIIGEKRRFHTLIKALRWSVECHISPPVELIVSALKFVNVVVHTVIDMNYRVHLQFEFNSLGYDQILCRMKDFKSEEIKAQVQAYYDNMIDVSVLINDSEARIAAESRSNNLDNKLYDEQEQRLQQEYDSLIKVVELEKQLLGVTSEVDRLKGVGRGVFALPGVHVEDKGEYNGTGPDPYGYGTGIGGGYGMGGPGGPGGFGGPSGPGWNGFAGPGGVGYGGGQAGPGGAGAAGYGPAGMGAGPGFGPGSGAGDGSGIGGFGPGAGGVGPGGGFATGPQGPAGPGWGGPGGPAVGPGGAGPGGPGMGPGGAGMGPGGSGAPGMGGPGMPGMGPGNTGLPGHGGVGPGGPGVGGPGAPGLGVPGQAGGGGMGGIPGVPGVGGGGFGGGGTGIQIVS